MAGPTYNRLDLVEVARVINAALAGRLAPYGFSHVEVEPRRGDDDEDVLFVRSVFNPAGTHPPSEVSVRAIHDAIEALSACGEDRFPVIVHAFPQDQAA